MSFNFAAQSLAGAPTVGLPPSKDVVVKAIKLVAADFSTGGTANIKAAIPADASIIGMRIWIKTALSGGGITAANISVGVPGAPTQFIGSNTAAGSPAATYSVFSISNIFQDYNIPLGADIQLLITGTATTGNPTAGEMYLLVEYVR